MSHRAREKFRPVGQCPCGATTDLVWDHVDPATKEFYIGTANHNGYADSTIKRELKKCRVICRGCNSARGQRKYSDDVVDEILTSSERVTEISVRLGIPHATISRIRNGTQRKKPVF